MGRIHRLIGVAGAIIAAAGATPAYAQTPAQDPYCTPCLVERWNSIEQIMLARAQRLKSARNLLRDARSRQDPALITRAQAHLDNVTRLWDEIDSTARALGSPSYKAHLARNLVEAETAYDQAHANWKKKVAQLDRLRGTLASERATILADIEGILKEEEAQRRRLGLDGVFNAAKGSAALAERAVHQLGRAPGAAGNASTIQLLNRLIGAQRAAEATRATHEAMEGHYWDAAIEYALLAGEILAPGSRAIPPLVAARAFGKFGASVAEIGLSHFEWRMAMDRLEAVSSAETTLQLNVALLAARVKSLEREREMATETIARQHGFERIQAQLRTDLSQ